jgi:membrane-associated phospholipid phosphatase
MTSSQGARIAWVTAGIGGAAAFVAIGLAVRGSTPAVDAWGLRVLSVPGDSGLGDLVGTLSTVLVIGLVLAAVGVGVAARVQGRATVPHLLRYAALLLVGQSMALLKEVFARPQPGHGAGLELSYPSGHTGLALTSSFILVLLVAEVYPRWTARVATVTGAVILLAMAGRLLAGEHYATDVLGTVPGVVGVLALAAVALGLLPVRPGVSRRAAHVP